MTQLKRWLVAFVLLLTALQVQAGTIISRDIASSALGRQWTYSVYLPDGYEDSKLRYPVFYLLHGNAGDHTAWAKLGGIQATADALIQSGDIPPTIIVMPDAGTTWYVDRKEKMETAMLEDLFPDVEKNFRTIQRRDGRLIGGLSMGGFGALRFSMQYPERFAAAALLSPAIYAPEPPPNSSARRVAVFGAPEFDPEVWKQLNYPALWDAYLAKKTPVPMYINSGDDDEFMIEADATVFYELLRKNKLPAELRIVDGAHTWPVWKSTIGDAMRYIYRFAAKPEAEK